MLNAIFDIEHLRVSNDERKQSLREHLSYDERAVYFLDFQPRVSGLLGPRFHKLRNGNVTSQVELRVVDGQLEGGPQLFGSRRFVSVRRKRTILKPTFSAVISAWLTRYRSDSVLSPV